jgi:hypothetical protein
MQILHMVSSVLLRMVQVERASQEQTSAAAYIKITLMGQWQKS